MATTKARTISGPLNGLRVIELAHVMAGPLCGRLLADMGADVIKVEKPPSGDDTRKMAPPWVGQDSAAYLVVNHNKRSIGLDVKTREGRDILTELLRDADVVIENFRRGTLERLGFSVASMAKLNPRLIICEISGFGRTGPYADHAGFDLIAQGMAGLLSITGEGPNRPPVKPGVAVADINSGLYACIGILAALAERNRTGKGGRVETSLFESAIAATVWHTAICSATGESPGAVGTAHPLDAPYQAFEAANGWITIGGANQATWLRLVKAIERPELASDSRFVENPDRVENLAALISELTPTLRQRTVQDWCRILNTAGVPAGPVNSIAQMMADPQARARQMIMELAHDSGNIVHAVGCPIKFDGHAVAAPRMAARLGEHTSEILNELGISTEQQREFRDLKAVF